MTPANTDIRIIVSIYGWLKWLTAILANLSHTPWTHNLHALCGQAWVCMAFRCYWYWDCWDTLSEHPGVINKDMYLSPTYLTYSVLITISINRLIPLPEDFCGVGHWAGGAGWGCMFPHLGTSPARNRSYTWNLTCNCTGQCTVLVYPRAYHSIASPMGRRAPPPCHTYIYIDNYTDQRLILLTTISCHLSAIQWITKMPKAWCETIVSRK